MSRDKQTEIHEIAKRMSEAISTEMELRYISDERKLEAALKENGWCKASDLAEEIFAELDTFAITKVVYNGEVKYDVTNKYRALKEKYSCPSPDEKCLRVSLESHIEKIKNTEE